MAAYVRLCIDVIDDVLKFGTRRQLSGLERLGRQFFNLIAERFIEKPFLALSLKTFFDRPIKFDRRGFELLLSAPGVPVAHENLQKMKTVPLSISDKC